MDSIDYKYVKKTTAKNGTVYYICSRFRQACRARLTVKSSVVAETGEHTCKSMLPDVLVDIRAQMRDRLHTIALEKISLSGGTVWDMVREELRSVHEDSSLQLVPKQADVTIVKNARSRIFGFDTLRAVEADGARLLNELDRRPFLQFNVAETAKDGKLRRMLGFGHPDLVCLLRYPGCTVFIDGTFKMAPPGFAQCLIIMCYDPSVDVYIPVFSVLADGKDQDMYWSVLYWVIIRTDRRLEPAAVTCDFELALINPFVADFCIMTTLSSF